MKMRRVIILYVPVLHKGYLDFFKKYHDAECLYIPNNKLIGEFMPLQREIRQIEPRVIRSIIKNAKLFNQVKILTHDSTNKLKNCEIVTSNDSVSQGLTKKYFSGFSCITDTIFLRWDEKNVYSQKPSGYDRISTEKFDRTLMEVATVESRKSSCWWRRIGAVLVKNKKIMLIRHNIHVPSELNPYSLGDPRDVIEAGKNNEVSTTLHAEEMIIAGAAKVGLGLKGASLYMTVFPCPKCAKIIAYSGIKKCYFMEGHASLDGLEVLKAKKVEIILVK